jgi:transposase, IS5 family
MQLSLFDFGERVEKIDSHKDTLYFLNDIIDWEVFRSTLNKVRENKQRKNNSGRKPFDVVLMFKILIIQSLYNLSDDDCEFQILDRISFMRFLGLTTSDRIPDSKTIWLFRNQLTKIKLTKLLFDKFDRFVRDNGFKAEKGQIIDASFVNVPIQRNTRKENADIKSGKTPESWKEDEKSCKLAQKDVDARWSKKNGKSYYGFKNHISIDAEYKFIRNYATSEASLHDSNVFDSLFDSGNRCRNVYADSAYKSEKAEKTIKKRGYHSKVVRKAYKSKPLSNTDKIFNNLVSKTRCRVEHIFGVQYQMARGSTIMRSIGKARAETTIGLRNLTYNMFRLKSLIMT